MNWSDLSKKAINAGRKGLEIGKKIAPSIFQNNEMIHELLKVNLNKELLKKKKILIPETIIHKEIAAIFNDIPNVSLESLSCRKDGIMLTFNISKYGTQTVGSARLQIQEAFINREKQKASLRVFDEKLIGKNILGKCASVLINLVIKDLGKTAVSSVDTEVLISFSDYDKLIIFDLSRLETIQNLLSPIKFMNFCVLDIASFVVRHEDSGISVTGEFRFSFEPYR
jgi:hypothetical protein